MQLSMSISIKPLFNDKITFWGFFLSLLLFMGTFVYLGIVYTHLPPFIPIYNKLPWGYGRLGTRMEIFIPVGLTFAFYICDIALSSYMYTKVPLLSRMLAIINFFSTALTTIFIYKIITLII